MRVKNPNYAPPEPPEMADMSAREVTIKNWFAANADKETVTFDQIRARYNKTDKQWPDGLIHQKLSDWGFEVVVE